MTGNVLDFSIWDAALSETEMAAMSEAGFPSIARQPFVTLNKENSERYGRISYVAQWAEWNDWTKCSVTCQSGLRTRSRVCYGGRAGDYGCDGDELETKGCYQGICEAIVQECSQSTWNLAPGGSASFKVTNNCSPGRTCCHEVFTRIVTACYRRLFPVKKLWNTSHRKTSVFYMFLYSL